MPFRYIVSYFISLGAHFSSATYSFFLFVRDVFSAKRFALVALFLFSGPSVTKAEYWETTLVGGPTISGPEGCSLAYQQYFDFYVTATYMTPCVNLYNGSGNLACVQVGGYGPGMTPEGQYIYRGSGNACTTCASDEWRTPGGCAKIAEIPMSRSIRVANSRSCGANDRANPVEVAIGRKLDSHVDFSSAGPLSLTLERFYRGPSVLPVKGSAETTMGQNWVSNFDVVASLGAEACATILRTIVLNREREDLTRPTIQKFPSNRRNLMYRRVIIPRGLDTALV